MDLSLLAKVAAYLNAENLVPAVLGFVSGALATWGFSQFVVVKAARERIEELKANYELRLMELGDHSARERAASDKRIAKLEGEVQSLNNELRSIQGMLIGRAPYNRLTMPPISPQDPDQDLIDRLP